MRYHYHGPATALTLSEDGELVDRLLSTGQIVENLPPEHPIVVRWLADRRLIPIDDGEGDASNPPAKVPAIAPPTAGTLSAAVPLTPPVAPLAPPVPEVTGTTPAPLPVAPVTEASAKAKPATNRSRRDG